MSSRYIGRSLKRVEDPRFLRGQGRYVDDVRLPGMVYAAFVRSIHGHAKILNIDTSVASSLTGVIGVYTAADFPHLRPVPVRLAVQEARPALAPPLAIDRVRFVGEPLAVVVAETPYQAADAAAAVEIEYEPLPTMTRPEESLAPDAMPLHPQFPDNVCYRIRRVGGDVAAAFAQAKHVVRVQARHHRLAPVPLEPRCILAQPSPSGGLTIWASCQFPFRIQGGIVESLGMTSEQVRVISMDVGGGFGAKGPPYREDVVVAALALRLERPVKWVATRIEDMLTTHHARDQVDEMEAAFDGDGRLLAVRTRTITALGAYVHHVNTLQPLYIPSYGTGAYQVPALEAEVLTVFTNTTPTGPYRGAGRPEAAFLIERLMDQAARQLSLDPAELRWRNLIQPDQFPYTTPAGTRYDSGNYPALLEKALALADYPRLRDEQRARRAAGELVGIGLAVFVETTGNGWESGAVRIEPDGRVTGITGSHSHGQGHETSFAQILADEFGVSLEQVSILHGDTSLLSTGVGTSGSRSTILGGGALVQAARAVKERLCAFGAELLETSADDLEVVAGTVRVRGAPERAVTLSEVATLAYARGAQGGDPLRSDVIFEPGRDAISSGAYIALVSVDRETGRIRIERLIAVDDCGTIVNPLLVEGQIHGGIVQGIGEALFERMVYGDDGQVLTMSLLDYALPVAGSVPVTVLGHTITPSPNNPLGVKGVGEAGTIGAPPAIVNAVFDALAPLGVLDLDLPLHSEKIWRAIRKVL